MSTRLPTPPTTQAQSATDGTLANNMFLPLAERLMDKYVLEKKLDVEEGTHTLTPSHPHTHTHTHFCVVKVVMLSQFA